MSWLSLPRFGPTSVGTDMTQTGKAQILKDSTDRARMLLHFGQPLINQVNSISQATLLTSGRLVDLFYLISLMSWINHFKSIALYAQTYFIQAAVQQWYEEVRDLPEDATLESYGDDSFGDKTTGHYTQVVWAETKMVGCGAISFKEKLNGKEYFAKRYVCNYYPPGNFLGNPVYIETEGEAGEACPNGTENGLCL